MTLTERDALILEHLPLAHRLARRYARSADSEEELGQVAAVGLIKAVDRFDPDRGIPFASFAIPTVLGELKRHFRDTRWALRVPRRLQERAQLVEGAITTLTPRLGRAPRPRDVAVALGLTLEEVLEARAAMRGYDALSLDAPVRSYDEADTDATMCDALGDEDEGFRHVEEREALTPLMQQLDERARLALHLRFVHDLTQAEIGGRLGISQMQVSRIIRGAIDELAEAAA